MASLLAAWAAPHARGRVLTAPAMLAGQLSVGWSNDAPGRRGGPDGQAGRHRLHQRAGRVIAAFAALLAALAMSLAIGVATAIILAVIIGAAWAYNVA
ncbi:MAG TPA: hypothetical protein VME67_19900 [Mycobacterium sp.]|nr:hypothetical protein [Mycobacterium sp.]HTX96908.1 hypothetical protein [Mycobacterium sp.]